MLSYSVIGQRNMTDQLGHTVNTLIFFIINNSIEWKTNKLSPRGNRGKSGWNERKRQESLSEEIDGNLFLGEAHGGLSASRIHSRGRGQSKNHCGWHAAAMHNGLILEYHSPVSQILLDFLESWLGPFKKVVCWPWFSFLTYQENKPFFAWFQSYLVSKPRKIFEI